MSYLLNKNEYDKILIINEKLKISKTDYADFVEVVENDEVTAKIVDFNEADKKISLSVKAMYAPEPKAEDENADVVSVDIDAVIAAEGTEE